MYCHHFQSSIRKCQEEERKGRTAEISFFVEEKMQEHHNSLERISSWIPSLTDGLLGGGGGGRHTFWHLPSSLQPCLNPCQNQELFHPDFLGPCLCQCPEHAGWEAILSICCCSTLTPLQSGHSLKMGVERLWEKPNSAFPELGSL